MSQSKDSSRSSTELAIRTPRQRLSVLMKATPRARGSHQQAGLGAGGGEGGVVAARPADELAADAAAARREQIAAALADQPIRFPEAADEPVGAAAAVEPAVAGLNQVRTRSTADAVVAAPPVDADRTGKLHPAGEADPVVAAAEVDQRSPQAAVEGAGDGLANGPSGAHPCPRSASGRR
jgi:hypothetical protein